MSALKKLASAIRFTIASSGSQNFLGTWWAVSLLKHARDKRKRALRLLFLSPHYFCLDGKNIWPSQSELEFEAERNRLSRQAIAEDIIVRFTRPSDVVLDYGCGPGFLATAVSPHVAKVFACDISDGVLACANLINPALNVEYLNADRVPSVLKGCVNVVFSFAVAQHLSDSILQHVLARICGTLVPGGKLLLHVVIDAAGWSTEHDWSTDKSITGRLKMRFGLHCFSRTRDQIIRLAEQSGLDVVDITPIHQFTGATDDDVSQQHLLIAIKTA